VILRSRWSAPQEVLYYLKRLRDQHRIPALRRSSTAPMATSIRSCSATYLFDLDEETQREFRGRHSPFDFPA
jgi:hypothetical protein